MPPSLTGSRGDERVREPLERAREQQLVLEDAAGEDDARARRAGPARWRPRRALWKRAAMSGDATPRARSSTTAASVGRGSRTSAGGAGTGGAAAGGAAAGGAAAGGAAASGAVATSSGYAPSRAGPPAPRARSRPGPRSVTVWRTPQSAATASNRRPMLVVSGEARPVRASCATCSQRSGSMPGSGAARAPISASHAQAIRHGSRIARLAAGHPHRPEVPDALESAQVAAQQLAAPDGAVGAVAGAVVDRADRRRRHAVLGEARREVRVVVLDADAPAASRSSAYLVERYSGWRSCATSSGATANSRSKCAMPR